MSIKRVSNLDVSQVVAHLEAMEKDVKRTGWSRVDIVNGYSVDCKRKGEFYLGCFGVVDIDRIAAKIGVDGGGMFPPDVFDCPACGRHYDGVDAGKVRAIYTATGKCFDEGEDGCPGVMTDAQIVEAVAGMEPYDEDKKYIEVDGVTVQDFCEQCNKNIFHCLCDTDAPISPGHTSAELETMRSIAETVDAKYTSERDARWQAETRPNCPILVGHLNALTAKGGKFAELALSLIAILDDVEGIASLADHEFPANRHIAERSKHIAEQAEKLEWIQLR